MPSRGHHLLISRHRHSHPVLLVLPLEAGNRARFSLQDFAQVRVVQPFNTAILFTLSYQGHEEEVLQHDTPRTSGSWHLHCSMSPGAVTLAEEGMGDGDTTRL